MRLIRRLIILLSLIYILSLFVSVSFDEAVIVGLQEDYATVCLDNTYESFPNVFPYFYKVGDNYPVIAVTISVPFTKQEHIILLRRVLG